MDIFYQDLSYEEIEQNIAFEFLSLLSEIGGFLGLLLGAVCELVDYTVLLLIRKVKRKKQRIGPKEGKAEDTSGINLTSVHT